MSFGFWFAVAKVTNVKDCKPSRPPLGGHTYNRGKVILVAVFIQC